MVITGQGEVEETSSELVGDREKNILRIHGPVRCCTECSACEGDHHWLEETFGDEEPEEVPAGVSDVLTDGHPYLVCKHCETWAECPEWWGETDDCGEDVAFEAVDVRNEADQAAAQKADASCQKCGGSGYLLTSDGHDEPIAVCCSKCLRFAKSEEAEAAYEADRAAAQKADAGKLVDEAPRSPAGEPVVLNTCGEQLREDADQDEAVNLDWTLMERTKIADAFRTVERRRKIMESTAESAKIAKKAFDTAVEQWHDITQVIVHGQPEIDETGQRNMFPSPTGTARTVGEWVEGGKGLKTGDLVTAVFKYTDDQVRHAISNICEATVWQNDLSRAGVSARVAAALDRANIRKPGDLMLKAARLGVRWWKEMGLEESEARTLMHRCLSCVLNVNDDVLPSVKQMLGAKLAGRIEAESDSDTAWSELMGVMLDDKALAARVPAQSRERFERAAGHLINGGVADIGSAAVLLVGEPQWWFTRFPGIEAEALDIEVFAAALPLAAQEHARAVLLGENQEEPNSDEPADDQA